MSTQDREKHIMIPLYSQRDIAITHGQGAYIFDEEGKKYLDLSSQYGVSILGHANEEVNQPIKDQLDKLNSCHRMFFNEARTEHCERLQKHLPAELNKFFLTSTGSEAVEAALKFARAASGVQEIISMTRGYHGRTYGSLSATHSPKYRTPFEPLVPKFTHCKFNDLDSLKEKISDKTAAVILELIQGEGGIIIADKNYIQGVRELCTRHGALLIIDEVQTGMGRTGKMWAFQHYDILPDMICISKGVANGLPLGLTVVTEDISSKIPKGSHGTTFGGNPLSSVAGTATLNFIEEHDLLEQVTELGKYFLDQLSAIDSDKIREVRGLGFMIAIELKEKVSKYLRALQNEGIIAISSGATVIRLLPPYIISKEDIDLTIEKIRSILNSN